MWIVRFNENETDFFFYFRKDYGVDITPPPNKVEGESEGSVPIPIPELTPMLPEQNVDKSEPSESELHIPLIRQPDLYTPDEVDEKGGMEESAEKEVDVSTKEPDSGSDEDEDPAPFGYLPDYSSTQSPIKNEMDLEKLISAVVNGDNNRTSESIKKQTPPFVYVNQPEIVAFLSSLMPQQQQPPKYKAQKKELKIKVKGLKITMDL